MISQTVKSELKQRVTMAITNREAAVDVMKTLQAHYGWLNDEAVNEAAEILGISTLQVEELATFYEMIYRRPVGKKVIHLCDSITCWSLGGEALLAHVARHLAIDVGSTTLDGIFTLLPCCCLGSCGEAPAMMVGDTIYGNLTMEAALTVIEAERALLRGAL